MTEYTPSFRSQFVVKRTYNRPLNEEGTEFETREQTIDRVVEHQKWLWETAKGKSVGEDLVALNNVEKEELEQLREILLSGKASLSGRTLWLGGTDISKKYHATQFNPLKRTEKFITSSGVKSFEDFSDGATVEVLTHTGNWKPAIVKQAGVREMLQINLKRSRSNVKIDSCKDHTWILQSGERVKASNLNIGDKLYMSPNLDFYKWNYDSAKTDEQLWWCYGFVFGDGAIAKSGNSVTSRVRLCGDKAKYLERFISFGFEYSYPPSCEEDPIVYTGKYLKTLPNNFSDPNMIKAFLHGYLAADGNKQDQGCGNIRYSGISVSNKEAAAFISKWCPVFGLYILSEKQDSRTTNYGVIDATVFSFTNGQRVAWEVESISNTPNEECWCLTVENDHSFVLPSGVVTGNCSFIQVKTVHDVVDAYHSLLLGVGVGFEPITGVLNGFAKPLEVEIIRSNRKDRGNENNQEVTYSRDGKKIWRLVVGDSGIAWSKAIGKLLAMKKAVDRVILDFSEVRPGGKPLRGFGWISSGDEQISEAFSAIAEILNKKAGQLLTRMDILDVMNWLGTSLSSRRSAEIALFPADDPEAEEFAVAKKDYWKSGNKQRSQSNNSLIFFHKPTKRELRGLFSQMLESGGSEPGFINGAAARKRAPWFRGVNPCSNK